jgi:hypothetical protein
VQSGGIALAFHRQAHDDCCNVVAGAAVLMAETLARQPQMSFGGIGVVTGPGLGAFGGNAEDLAYAASRGSFYGGGKGGLVW